MEQLEKLSGVVERISFHNEQNGWTVLKVSSFKEPKRLITVVVHQDQIFAGATMEFWGRWSTHSKYGEQFKAQKSVEKKPASTAALEKYLGSGLISGVGPITAQRIVSHFKERTLEIFEDSIDELTQVPGIAKKKLKQIQKSWDKHRALRDVMIFLQSHGVSSLFATKIYKTYGDQSIALVSENPYRLAKDIYGIGFFSADRIALTMGFLKDGRPRIEAGIQHVLSASRDEGHCFLTKDQIISKTLDLLKEPIPKENILDILLCLQKEQQVMVRTLPWKKEHQKCFYSKSLYYDELKVFDIIKKRVEQKMTTNEKKIHLWVQNYCDKNQMNLSDDQYKAVCTIPTQFFSILTGGPGCGKTTCTKVLVRLLKSMGKKVTLAAPTGRAAQRMGEVIGYESKTIHRLLEWMPQTNSFKHNEQNPIQSDFLILDEVSMLDISLSAHLLQALRPRTQVLFIGDPDQLPAVGAGRVLGDLLDSPRVQRFRLSKVFRQAQKSLIIRFAHELNSGKIPKIPSPIHNPQVFDQGKDCLFFDSEQATQEQIRFIQKVRHICQNTNDINHKKEDNDEKIFYSPNYTTDLEARAPLFQIPEKFQHVDLAQVVKAKSDVEELTSVLKSVHPWSSLKYGLTALDTLIRLYTKTIHEWFNEKVEIQILSPQVRGSLGTLNLNSCLQKVSNPPSTEKKQLTLGEKTLRVKDRVIQTRNNYDLGVFNGDIGKISQVNLEEFSCTVEFASKRHIVFKKEDLRDLQLAYAITVHKSQGSEFDVVLIPILGQHYNMLFRNLIYTGLTRAKKLALFVGNRKAFSRAVQQIDVRKRQTALKLLLDSPHSYGLEGR